MVVAAVVVVVAVGRCRHHHHRRTTLEESGDRHGERLEWLLLGSGGLVALPLFRWMERCRRLCLMFLVVGSLDYGDKNNC